MAWKAGRWWSGKAVALFLLLAVQVVLADGIQQKFNTQASHATLTDSPSVSNSVHGIQKRSVSILARNGDLPYIRKEWNKKLHPGFRGMNADDKDVELVPSKRYVGALARGGGYPTTMGKRIVGIPFGAVEGITSEEAPLESYVPEDWSGEDASEFAEGKRGGISSLAREGGLMTYQGQYANGKRSVAALARSGELLSIGRGSSQEREGSGSSASKRGLSSILRNGGTSSIRIVPVYSTDSSSNAKRGIESLARNYALPSMINQEYDTKFDLPEREIEDPFSEPITGPLYKEAEEPNEMDTTELTAKRHLGSFVRAYGFKPGMKRNIGSILRNGGRLSYVGEKREEFSPYEEDYNYNDKRHFSSLLKNHGAYAPHKRLAEENMEFQTEKRHLSSILQDKNAFINGKRYLGSIARQGLLGHRQEKREDVEWGLNEGEGSRTDSTVGKRSIAEGDSGLSNGEASFDRQDNWRETNETTEDELKNAAGPVSPSEIQKRSTSQAQGETKKVIKESSKRRQRRSLNLPYSSSDEYPMPVFQNTDFNELGNTEEEELDGSPEKRFMGSLDRWDWFPRQFPFTATPDDGEGAEVVRFKSIGSQGWPGPVGATFQLRKRHIGALARLGWLPAIRSQRRYSRGLGKRSEEELIGGRKDSTHGTESTPHWYSHADPFPPEAPLTVSVEEAPRQGRDPLDTDDFKASDVQWSDGWWMDPVGGDSLRGVLTEKRYLLLPAIDHLLLRKLYPRRMLPLLI